MAQLEPNRPHEWRRSGIERAWFPDRDSRNGIFQWSYFWAIAWPHRLSLPLARTLYSWRASSCLPHSTSHYKYAQLDSGFFCNGLALQLSHPRHINPLIAIHGSIQLHLLPRHEDMIADAQQARQVLLWSSLVALGPRISHNRFYLRWKCLAVRFKGN